jgi:tRNA1Val (adenine37-N6)-methyltransferase
MKVTTDACLFGGYVAQLFYQSLKKSGKESNSDFRVLDIGTGTGVLSLMLAQKTQVLIDAVEIDQEAATQAEKNFSNSPWKNRLQVYNADVKSFHFKTQYDGIIVNPPFFEKHLQSNHRAVNQARHSVTLGYDEILQVAKSALKPEGWLAVLMPYSQFNVFEEKAFNSLFYLRNTLLVRQSASHNYFRQIGIFIQFPVQAIREELIISESGTYSKAFINLLGDYYLFL